MWTRAYKILAQNGVLAAASLLLLSSCNMFATIGGPVNSKAGVDHVDPTLDLTRGDYRHLAAPKEGDQGMKVTVEKGAPPIPRIADILAAPRPPKIGETQLVSIAVTDDVPLKDVLLELAKLADVDIELDAGITGGIEFIAKDKPFNEVIDRIAELANLRYTMKNGVLRVERDTTYIQSYALDFLNRDVDSDSSVNLSTNVLSTSTGGGSGSGGGGGGSSGGGLTTGSNSSVKSKAKGDFWKSLKDGVTQILAYQPATHLSATTLQAETEANSFQQAASKEAGGAPAQGGAAAAGAAAAPALSPIQEAANNTIANGLSENKTSFTINQQAGVLTVNATGRQHELIQRFIDTLKTNASAQVLIEAKIIEVDLNESYQSGINWQSLNNKIQGAAQFSNTLISPAAGSVIPPVTNTGNGVSFAINNGTDIINFLETFGTLRTLSSPRLHAINNQQSTMTFAKNQVYFTLTITPPTTTTTGTVTTGTSSPTISSSLQTVPIGIMMTMMPSIDMENSEVTLAVRPTLSTIVGEVQDPAATIAAKEVGLDTLTSNVPVVQVRELDSTLKLKSGQTMVIGGLMQQTAQNDEQGVPFGAGIPIVGNLLKSVGRTVNNTELVLLIKATIVDTRGSMNKTDETIFHKFSDDPRPVSF